MQKDCKIYLDIDTSRIFYGISVEQQVKAK